ncbi:MAG: DNA polymerase IV [Planctomycetota bacterium]
MATAARSIIHVDMDEFFAAVAKLDDPTLRGRPLLIGGRPDQRGVVATASYEARRYGCRSAMPMATALRLCPAAVVRRPDGRRYREVSEAVFAIFARYTPTIEPLSIDEAFLDLSGTERLHGPALGVAEAIRAAIRAEIGITASVGVAPNKFLAKLASDLDKPDGLTVITAANLRDVLDPLDLATLWGVGPAAAKRLRRIGLHTIGDIHRCDPDRLVRELGETSAAHLKDLAAGRDIRPVVPDHSARSIGQEQTFATDIGDARALRAVLLTQVEAVSRRLRRQGLKARTVSIKLRYADFTTISRSHSLPVASDVTRTLWRAAVGLFETWARSDLRPLRLLGVTATRFDAPDEPAQLSLFDDPDDERQRRLDAATDSIAQRFGDSVMARGAGFRSGGRSRRKPPDRPG